MTTVAHWLPRAALAAIFLFHGGAKFPAAQGMADMMGMPIVMVYLLATMEVTGALLILWGGAGPDWATRAGGAIFSIVMVGAIGLVHMQHGWNSVNMGTGNEGRGMEFQVLILAVSLFFALRGNTANDGAA
ncbi:MAG TPA: DoxX family protein [Acidobacteriota bacterium]|jgi:putative oxidoreductase